MLVINLQWSRETIKSPFYPLRSQNCSHELPVKSQWMMLKSFEILICSIIFFTFSHLHAKLWQIRRPKRRPRPVPAGSQALGAGPATFRSLWRLNLCEFGDFFDDFYGSICLKPSIYHQNCGPHIIIYDWFMIIGQFDLIDDDWWV